ncbi:hypothetical protein [Enterococcus sp. AZ180]|uniref:hypothetical protein n=1 Tax=Enterococcus sp. AZ180 TaxID=2774961 RepID=UPI003F257C6F
MKNEETEIWEQRVFYPELKYDLNKKETEMIAFKINGAFRRMREDFVLIHASYEADIYKIGHYFVSNLRCKNEAITFLDGDIIESYLAEDKNSTNYNVRNLVEKLVKSQAKQIVGKIVFIPELNMPFSKLMAIFFVNELKKIGVKGVIFHSDKELPDTLAQILIEETTTDVTQFPYFPKWKWENVCEDKGYNMKEPLSEADEANIEKVKAWCADRNAKNNEKNEKILFRPKVEEKVKKIKDSPF